MQARSSVSLGGVGRSATPCPSLYRHCCYSTAHPSSASSSGSSSSSSRVLRASRSHGGLSRSAWTTRASSGSKGSSEADPISQIGDALNRFVKDATPKVESAVDELKRSASRTYQRLDTEYEVSAKASKASKRLQEKVTDVDQEWGIRRRLRLLREDAVKAAPVWSRKFNEYAATPMGRFSVICGVLLLMTTSVFWKVINWVFFLWWLAIPIAVFTIQKQASETLKRAQEQQAAEEEERRDPLGSMFRRATQEMGERGRKQGGAGGSGAKPRGGGSTSSRDGGPVIDAEWNELK
ncbi:hypothetical protein FOA52_005423 [Chlamydomonas sp. UWO 241]|nr:hypothetical protein FOA52_005423 [Chlamydomonas sp. UWO 241]